MERGADRARPPFIGVGAPKAHGGSQDDKVADSLPSPSYTFGITALPDAHQSSGNGLDAQLDLERDLQREAGRTADYAEGVKAFLEKRKAVFRGRAG